MTITGSARRIKRQAASRTTD